VIKDLESVVAVHCGGYYTVAVTRSGKVVCWGSNDDGQCRVPEELKDVVAVSCGDGHTAAVTRDGEVVCWGRNRYGQCTVPDA
jgi:alpha-tubulin suppressor-like RCC1 family protein